MFGVQEAILSSLTFLLTLNTIPLFGTNFEREDIVLDTLFSTLGGVDGKGGKSSSSRPGGFGCSGAIFRLKVSGKGFL